MNTRDELIQLIQDVGEYIPGSHADDYISPTKAADAVLAAGYRKPRQVITPEEVCELPDGSLIMSGDRIRMYDGAVWRIRGGMVEMVGREARGVTPFRYFVDPLPATVLYEPGQP